jgi:hypothetical protein
MENEQPLTPETPKPFLRIEVDKEHKFFTKTCTECGQEFRTVVPRAFFEHPEDDSIELAVNSSGTMRTAPKVYAEDVERIIANPVCQDTERHAKHAEAI